MSFLDVLSIEALTVSLAFIGFVFGVWQYRKAQGWQRAEAVLSLIDRFERNENLQGALRILDSDEENVTFEGENSAKLSWAGISNALRVVPATPATTFSPEERMVRDAFDAFFDFLVLLQALQKSGLLLFSDYRYFYYWFEILSDERYWSDAKGCYRAIPHYMDSYGYGQVRALLHRYAKRPEPVRI